MNWLDRVFLKLALKKGAAMLKTLLQGKVTYISGAGLIFGALALLAKMITDNDFSRLEDTATMFLNGLGLLGLRRAISGSGQ